MLNFTLIIIKIILFIKFLIIIIIEYFINSIYIKNINLRVIILR